MSPFRRNREKEVTDLLRRGHWPQASPAELRTHVRDCRSCSDLVLVSQTMEAARTSATNAPQLATAGALWWRAQLRRRNQTIDRISRPILGAQIFAISIVVAIAVGFFIWEARAGFHPLAWIEDLPQALHLEALLPAGFPHFSGAPWLLLPIVASLVLVSGVVAYFASEKH